MATWKLDLLVGRSTIVNQLIKCTNGEIIAHRTNGNPTRTSNKWITFSDVMCIHRRDSKNDKKIGKN